MSDLYVSRGEMRRQVARSKQFNIDNGSGTTDDCCVLRHSQPIRLKAARAVYTDATTGTVAAATIQLGITVTGSTVIAATALENSKGIGVSTALTLAITDIAANTPLIARHTGVATTAAGEYFLELEYVVLG